MVQLGDRLARLRRIASVTQEGLADRAGISVDVIKKLEQGHKLSARLPTLHALAQGLGVELTALLGQPPALKRTETDSPQLVAVRRAVSPPLVGLPPETSQHHSIAVLRIGWQMVGRCITVPSSMT